MKKILLLMGLSCSITVVMAQQKIELAKKPVQLLTTEQQIKKELNTLLDTYIFAPNTAATWAEIRMKAQNLLMGYWRAGRLIGVKAADAYYAKMGPETMSAADLANKKMILIAGCALYKPGEFVIIKVEKINTL